LKIIDIYIFSTKVWLQLAQWFLRRFLCEFPIGSYVKLSSAVGAILIEGPNRRTHFWILSQKVPKFELYKHNGELFNIYYGIFYEIWTFVFFDRLCKLEKRGDEIKKKSSPLKLLWQSQPNFAEMILAPFFLICIIGQNRQKLNIHKKSCNIC
jgi:hypothetical protein